MQFGLFMMPLHPPYRAFADAYDRDVDQIILADQLGFREAWIQQLYEESGGFGTLLSITTDSDDAGWDHESLRLLMEQVAPRIGC